MYYAFIMPPVFCHRNARRFAIELYRCIIRGSDDELKVIANELARSAHAIIKYSKRLPSRLRNAEVINKKTNKIVKVEDYAHDILLLIANRKFCRQIVAVSPVTVQAFFGEVAGQKKFDIPIGQFARNISSEAISQKGSFIYGEDDIYSSGLLGHLKPVSLALYGNYDLLEYLDGNSIGSPLDIDYAERRAWDSEQLQAYCRATLLAFKGFLGNKNVHGQAFALFHAMENIENCCGDLYKLNDTIEVYNSDICQRLDVVVKFVKDAIDLIDRADVNQKIMLRIRKDHFLETIYDRLASMMFDICLNASDVNSPPDTCWMVHHNIVWDAFSNVFSGDGAAWKIVRFKLRRMLYDEILRLNKFPNYKGARILGYCLNVLGVNTGASKQMYGRDTYALAKAVQSWAKKNYLSMRQKNQDVAEAVLIGRLSFDGTSNRLVITCLKGLNQEAPKIYLELISQEIQRQSEILSAS
jgi:hypothetical protein